MRRINPNAELEWAVVIMDDDTEVAFFESRTDAMEAAKEAEDDGVRQVFVMRAVAARSV